MRPHKETPLHNIQTDHKSDGPTSAESGAANTILEPDGSVGSATSNPANNPDSDPVFQEEQRHLSSTYEQLQSMGKALLRKMEKTRTEAAKDKRSMAEELSTNFATYADAMETYADFAAMNRVIDAYNLAQDADAEQLSKIHLLLEQPYFAKLSLQFKPGQDPKELYLGTAGISDESCRRLVVDWRSPVAEVYYNQDNGPTSYVADGRTINVDLKLRRQFDIHRDQLRTYFDTTVAIQDSLLLASLSKQRTSRMQAITATIQKEQNLVVRHEDVPALLVSGIAGSGKTSVLLQRIAYLFYQNRHNLSPDEVFLISPNPVFKHYIANVLPDLGERNPEILTWNEFAQKLLPPDRETNSANVTANDLRRIDAALAHFEFDASDFKDIRVDGTRLISADQARKLSDKFRRIECGPHRVTLIREELHKRLEGRLSQMAGTDDVLDELSALTLEEQLRIFHEPIAPADEQEERALALRLVRDRYAAAFDAVENDDWLRIDRIGMRLLQSQGLSSLEWLYLKMALTGLGNPQAKYVMVDEVQDYTAAQLMVFARYFRRAHFLLLGDPNQAIAEKTASFEEVREVFRASHGHVEECRLTTSYRSTPEITQLFASLLDESERMEVSAIQRADTPPVITACADDQAYREALTAAVSHARSACTNANENDELSPKEHNQAHANGQASTKAAEFASPKTGGSAAAEENADGEGLCAIIVPWKREAKRLQALLGEDAPELVDDTDNLPESGLVLITLKLAKGLEFDRVIIPDASARVFPDNPLSRRRLYTTISRATRFLTILSQGELTPLLRNTKLASCAIMHNQ